MHYFGKSLKAGQAGEKAFQALALAAGIALEATSGREGDFKDSNGDVWEVKTDSYDMNKTSNYFIEAISNANKGTKGGPYQAEEHGCKYFVYFFLANQTAFVFRTSDLLAQLLVTPMGAPIDIVNVGHTTIGFKVPRASLKHDYTITKAGKSEIK